MSIMQATLTVFVLFCANSGLSIMRFSNKSKIYSDSQIVFPESVENVKNDIKEVPLDLIRRLNEVTSMDEFLTMMVEHKNTESTDISDRIGMETVERSSSKTAKMAKCMPELQTVSLKPEKASWAFYYPSCTRVKRCGGCCMHDLFACRPVEKEIIPMKVAVAEYKGGHQLQLRETKIVEVEQHTRCECGCKIQPEDCTIFQKYSPEKCKCECTNIDKERKCYKESNLKIWDPDNCICVCKEELKCGSGFEFDPYNCSCVPSRGRRKPSSFTYEID